MSWTAHLIRNAVSALLLVLTGLASPALAADPTIPRLIKISTGARTGIYYYAGGGICAQVNAHRWRDDLRCITEVSNGSIDNLARLRRGDAEFAIVQSDWQFHALEGTDVFEPRGPDRALRSLTALYPEPFSILVRGTSGIARFSDLAGKRVSIGPLGSGVRATMQTLMTEMGWTSADFGFLADYGTDELAQALCSGDIDAAVMVIAHPNLAVEDILTACDIVIVPVDHSFVSQLTEAHPYMFRYAIPSGTYIGQTSNIDTFALAATLVTAAQTPPAVVRNVLSALFDNLSDYRTRHPSFAEFNTEEMLRQRGSAPLHSAARAFYSERGWITDAGG